MKFNMHVENWTIMKFKNPKTVSEPKNISTEKNMQEPKNQEWMMKKNFRKHTSKRHIISLKKSICEQKKYEENAAVRAIRKPTNNPACQPPAWSREPRAETGRTGARDQRSRPDTWSANRTAHGRGGRGKILNGNFWGICENTSLKTQFF